MAAQSGTWSGRDVASRAVDGNTNARLMSGFCAHPDEPGQQQAWWMVDLGALHQIYNVTVFNRDSSKQ